MLASHEALKNLYRLEGAFDQKAEQEQSKEQKVSIPIIEIEGVDEMKNVTLRKDGRYMARVQKHGQIYTIYARTTKQIQVKLRNLKQKLKEQDFTKTKFTLHSWLDFWWQNYKQPFVKPESQIPFYIEKIKNLLLNDKLENYTTAKIQRKLNEQKASRSKELLVLYLNASFEKAVDTGVLKLNPMKAVIKDRKITNIRKAFTFDEQKMIFEKIKGTKIERDILIYLFTGMRRNEYNPQTIRENVDIEHNTLKIQSEKKRTTNPVFRLVDLSPAMVKLILSENKTPQLSITRIFKNFKNILKELGIEGGLHTLRHTFGTNYYYMGVPDKLRSEWLGHEKVDLTQDIYTNIDRSISKEKLIELYGDFLYKI